MLQFLSEINMSKQLLSKNVRQLTYLQNLSKVQEEESSTCPICTLVLDQTQEVRDTTSVLCVLKCSNHHILYIHCTLLLLYYIMSINEVQNLIL